MVEDGVVSASKSWCCLPCLRVSQQEKPSAGRNDSLERDDAQPIAVEMVRTEVEVSESPNQTDEIQPSELDENNISGNYDGHTELGGCNDGRSSDETFVDVSLEDDEENKGGSFPVTIENCEETQQPLSPMKEEESQNSDSEVSSREGDCRRYSIELLSFWTDQELDIPPNHAGRKRQDLDGDSLSEMDSGGVTESSSDSAHPDSDYYASSSDDVSEAGSAIIARDTSTKTTEKSLNEFQNGKSESEEQKEVSAVELEPKSDSKNSRYDGDGDGPKHDIENAKDESEISIPPGTESDVEEHEDEDEELEEEVKEVEDDEKVVVIENTFNDQEKYLKDSDRSTVAEWQEIKDSRTGRYYYFNKISKESVWIKPKGFDEFTLERAKVERKRGSSIGWVETIDEQGRIYYYNKNTMESRWDRPSSLSIITALEKSRRGSQSSCTTPTKSHVTEQKEIKKKEERECQESPRSPRGARAVTYTKGLVTSASTKAKVASSKTKQSLQRLSGGLCSTGGPGSNGKAGYAL